MSRLLPVTQSQRELGFEVSEARLNHLTDMGIHQPAFWNLPLAQLYVHALEHDNAVLANNGALCVRSGKRCGRSPADKRIVENAATQGRIDWGQINRPIRPAAYRQVRQRAIDFLNSSTHRYVVDGLLGGHSEFQFRVRVVTSRPSHALFMRNLLIDADVSDAYLEHDDAASNPDIVVLDAGAFPADAHTPDLTSSTCVAIDLDAHEMTVLGTEFVGEIKKGLFTMLHEWGPARGVLPLHAAANVGAAGDVTLFLGLSGTGKTALALDPHRCLIGDDELGWSSTSITNFEGGCHAKCNGLSRPLEPMLAQAMRFGTVLENVVCDEATGDVDFTDDRITENARANFPLAHVPNHQWTGRGQSPANVVLLTCDAFGVLPPVSRLSHAQAVDWFGLGYTAKVSGTEVGVNGPQATFSPGFGAPFMTRHPRTYVDLFEQRLRQAHAQCWLVNTGWEGGGLEQGRRIELSVTRSIVDAIHAGQLNHCDYTTLDVLGLEVPVTCPGVPDDLLDPTKCWSDSAAYRQQASQLRRKFERTRERLNRTPNQSMPLRMFHRSAF